MTNLLDGRKVATEQNRELKKEIESLISQTKVVPQLATILVGENPASKVYISIKDRTCKEVGIKSLKINLPSDTSKSDLISEIEKLNSDDSVHGILLQLPLPDTLQKDTQELIQLVDSKKDVDGFSYINRGKLFDYREDLAPCTPKGIINLLEYYNISLKGKDVVIINRSNLVGKPLIFMFLKRNATVSICHTSTKDLESYMKNADILIVAIGNPNFVTKEKIKQNAILIDVGTNRVEGKLCGDVDFQNVYEKASWITPNPGGVGPMTVSSLMKNTLIAYKIQLNLY